MSDNPPKSGEPGAGGQTLPSKEKTVIGDLFEMMMAASPSPGNLPKVAKPSSSDKSEVRQ